MRPKICLGRIRALMQSRAVAPMQKQEPRAAGLRRLGPYAIESILGRGGFGTVYRARDERTDEAVALKVLHPAVASDPALLRRFLEEAATTSHADSPHAVRVVDAHENLEGHACIAFELLDGETLEAHIRREGTLAPDEAIDIAVQLLDGLEVAHERGVVHRDIKPANLFLVNDGMRTRCVKILDFGVGRLASSERARLTATGTSIGSPFYMAPEQMVDSAGADARADLYAVAVCLFRMLSGALPHGEGPASAWLTFVAQGASAPRVCSPRTELPESLVEAVAIGLSPRPERRWQNATAFARALLDSLPGASAPTRISYEPAAALHAPVPERLMRVAACAPEPMPLEEAHDVRHQVYTARSGEYSTVEWAGRSLGTPVATTPVAAAHDPRFELPREPPRVALPPKRWALFAVIGFACGLLLLAAVASGMGIAFAFDRLGQNEPPSSR
jgi:serine/threonine-protein kinase